jgi:hypothetical protein
MRATLRLTLLALVLAACGSPPPQETTPAPPEPPAEATEGTAPPAPTAAPPPPASVPGPAPVLSVTGTPATVGQHVAISVVNRGPSAAELGTAIAIEVEHDGAFVPTDRGGLTLRYDCAQEPPACVTLAPGAELIPPEWLGTWGDVQCVCTRCGPVEPGTYRFVVTTCDGAHRVEGTPFTMR